MAYKQNARLLWQACVLSSYYQAASGRFFFCFVESAEIKKVLVLALSKSALAVKIRL